MHSMPSNFILFETAIELPQYHMVIKSKILGGLFNQGMGQQ